MIFSEKSQKGLLSTDEFSIVRRYTQAPPTNLVVRITTEKIECGEEMSSIRSNIFCHLDFEQRIFYLSFKPMSGGNKPGFH